MKEIIKVTLRLTIIMVIAALALGGTHVMTRDPIAAQDERTREAKRLEVLGNASSFEEMQLAGEPGSITALHKGVDAAGNLCGYTFLTHANGFGGEFSLTVGVDAQGSVTGVRINSHAETPGLGAKATEPAFYDQYVGTTGEVAVLQDGGQIHAITAATITSRAISDAVTGVLDYCTQNLK